MSIFSKIKWILAIVLVFLLILATNLIDRKNFRSIRDSLNTIYQDRLIAKDILYDINSAVYEKQLALAQRDSSFFKSRNLALNDSIEESLERFARTRLTRKEETTFKNLSNDLGKLMAQEENLASMNYVPSPNMTRQLARVRRDLEILSQIQIKEGRRQVMKSERTMNSIELFTELEIYILIFLAVLVQIIVVYQPNKRKKSEN